MTAYRATSLWFRCKTGSLLLLLLCTSAYAANEQWAVVRIPSHGASATVIATQPGRTWLLGCGHAYQGADRNKPMAFDIATMRPAQPKKVSSHLLTVDYQLDLSLVLLDEGPLEFVAKVAPPGHDPRGHQILSCGFDEMKFPMHQEPATILRDDGHIWWTKEMPWHGRSGGGLLDMTSGCLIGVVSGYDLPHPGYRSHPNDPACHGMYVDLRSIHTFLTRYNSGGASSTPQPKPLSQPLIPRPCPGGR